MSNNRAQRRKEYVMKMYRQGDVIIVETDEVIQGEHLVPTKRGYVLAEGEATGHAHTIDAEGVEMFEREGTLFLRTAAPKNVTHEEHHMIVLPPGNYKVMRQREYHESEEWRYVAD